MEEKDLKIGDPLMRSQGHGSLSVVFIDGETPKYWKVSHDMLAKSGLTLRGAGTWNRVHYWIPQEGQVARVNREIHMSDLNYRLGESKLNKKSSEKLIDALEAYLELYEKENK